MSRPTQITIDLRALRHNFATVKQLAPHCAVLAMVKSNAYGHGLERIAQALPDADALGVACLEEGMKLRDAGVKNQIVLLEGLFREDELSHVVNKNFCIVIHDRAQVEMLEKNPELPAFPVWLKIDTGMHRLGFQPSEFKEIYQRLLQCPAVIKPIGFMTHFSESESLQHAITQKQIDLFNDITKNLPGQRSLANSGAILGWPAAHGDWVRPGIMLYGASPFSHRSGRDHGLQPVMSLTSQLIAIHQVNQGDRVGYGGTWVCSSPMTIGIVAAGYGDGYPRHAKNGTPILVNGQRCELAGRVSMDMLAVNLQSQPHAKIGDPVVLWGPELPVEEIAEFSETTAYELLTRITQRVRVVVQPST